MDKTLRFLEIIEPFVNSFPLVIVSYLIGSIPFGLLLTKIIKKIDIRNNGSGNIGATNAFRVGGVALGLLTLLLDFTKGSVTILISQLYDYEKFGICGLICLLGHVYPIWLGFKGGKGVATTLGIMFIVYPNYFCIMIIVWLITFKLSNIPSIASLLSLITTILVLVGNKNHLNSMYIVSSLILVILQHKDNILRIINRKEDKLYFKK